VFGGEVGFGGKAADGGRLAVAAWALKHDQENR
jgi:hypothetical protein